MNVFLVVQLWWLPYTCTSVLLKSYLTTSQELWKGSLILILTSAHVQVQNCILYVCSLTLPLHVWSGDTILPWPSFHKTKVKHECLKFELIIFYFILCQKCGSRNYNTLFHDTVEFVHEVPITFTFYKRH